MATPIIRTNRTESAEQKLTDWKNVGKGYVKVANIYATRNYDMFRFLPGNRDTKHSKKIMSSIKSIGILFQPVLVNEKYEIIEGQGRYVACKMLNLPILYVMQKGIGIKECSYLNSVSTNWNVKDYIHRFACGEDGINPGAKYLEELIKEFPGYSASLCYNIAANSGFSAHGKRNANFKKGDMPLTEEEYQHGRDVLTYLDRFEFAYKHVEGRLECLQGALAFFYCHPDIDSEFLYRQMRKRYVCIPPLANNRQAIEALQEVYNYNSRARKQVSLISDWELSKVRGRKKNGNA